MIVRVLNQNEAYKKFCTVVPFNYPIPRLPDLIHHPRMEWFVSLLPPGMDVKDEEDPEVQAALSRLQESATTAWLSFPAVAIQWHKETALELLAMMDESVGSDLQPPCQTHMTLKAGPSPLSMDDLIGHASDPTAIVSGSIDTFAASRGVGGLRAEHDDDEALRKEDRRDEDMGGGAMGHEEKRDSSEGKPEDPLSRPRMIASILHTFKKANQTSRCNGLPHINLQASELTVSRSTKMWLAGYKFDERRLHLATTVFRCITSETGQSRDEPLFYPRVLCHDFAFSGSGDQCVVRLSRPILLSYDATRSTPWNQDKVISIWREAAHVMHRIIEVVGLDPSTTTCQKLDMINPVLGCRHIACRHEDLPEAVKYAMRWRGAVRPSHSHPMSSSRRIDSSYAT